MEQMNIIEQLKTLKYIKPSEEFAFLSKQAILQTSRRRAFDFSFFFRPLYVGGFASVFAFLLALSFILPKSQEQVYASLDLKDLTSELDDVTISVQLREIEYNKSIETTIASALKEISSDEAKHLNPSLLQEEKGDVNEIDDVSQQIDKLLQEVLQ